MAAMSPVESLLLLTPQSFLFLLAHSFLLLAKLIFALSAHLFFVVDAVDVGFVWVDHVGYSSILRILVVGLRITPSMRCSGTGISKRLMSSSKVWPSAAFC
jgi:hypothetical protein